MELEEVAMPPDRRTRTAVAGALPVVPAVARSRGRLPALRDTRHRRRNVVQDPVHVHHLRRLRIRGIGIVDDQREALRSRRRAARSEEHTSELQSQSNLVCRLLLEKKKKKKKMKDR